MDRLHEPLQSASSWKDHYRRKSYISRRCTLAFKVAYFQRYPNELEELAEPGLALELDFNNDIVVELTQNGKFPERLRRRFVGHLIDFCVEGIDPAVLWSSQLRSVVTSDEWEVLRSRLVSEVFDDPFNVYFELTCHFEDHLDPAQFSEPLEQFADAIEREFPDDPTAISAAEEMREIRWDWVGEQEEKKLKEEYNPDAFRIGADTTVRVDSNRSVFDDLVASS